MTQLDFILATTVDLQRMEAMLLGFDEDELDEALDGYDLESQEWLLHHMLKDD
jgi:hypothetical protein